MYFNTHTHLNSEELFDQRDHYIQNALEKGVGKYMYFNTHTHLNSEELFDQRDHYIQNALEKGVNHMTVVGYDVASSQRALEIAHEYDFVYATVGISPNDCLNTTDEDLTLIAKMAEDDKVVALGEIGLDYYYDDVPKEKQMDVFKKQIKIAQDLSLPITIHCRDAYEDTYNVLEKANLKGIMHCYSGSDQMALRFQECQDAKTCCY